ncbi:MAG TPA: response regulator transcription factor [Candidatus Acidoferrales bacterium]|nr:response regulator transcription factor [Candidatus Acidoferrales bacterium]
MHILLVDDDTELASLLSEFLTREGFAVSSEHEGFRGLDRARKPDIDLVVLDVMLPGIDGFEILRRLRAESKVPVVMLTARGDDVDRIVGLDLGADDYLPKPFNPKELAARIRSVLRRYESHPAAASGRIEVGGVTLDPAARTVVANGKPVDLTTFEFDILELLMRSSGKVLSRDSLMEKFYNRKATPFDRSIDMHISHLRKKLENGEGLIKTIRGVGYQFCPSPADSGSA